TSGHKYGLVYPGVGWIVWRDTEALPDDLIFWVNYLGDNMPTFALNFSRPGSQVVAQYYNFLRLGFDGYRRVQGYAREVATGRARLRACRARPRPFTTRPRGPPSPTDSSYPLTPPGWRETGRRRVGPFATHVTWLRPDGTSASWSSRVHRKHASKLSRPGRTGVWWAPRRASWWIGALVAIGCAGFL